MLDTLGLFQTERSNMAQNKEQFTQAEHEWNLEELYNDLASVKGKNLTPMEKLHLRGLLCGYRPAEIAEKLDKSPNGLEVDLSQTVYHYVKNFVNRGDQKIDSWRNISQWLEEAGYKHPSKIHSPSKPSLPLEAQVKIENITIENQTMDIGIFVQITVPFSSNMSKTPAQ
jgi:hypothetical protein